VAQDERVLIFVMNNVPDFEIARDYHWYRIPVRSAVMRWRYAHLAFYQTRASGDEKWAVQYCARVLNHSVVRRCDLLPSQANHPRAHNLYYGCNLEPLPSVRR
jgi:hypothetical protein